MFRADYMLIAETFQKTRPTDHKTDNPIVQGLREMAKIQWEFDLHMIELTLERDNPRFDSHKFRKVAYA